MAGTTRRHPWVERRSPGSSPRGSSGRSRYPRTPTDSSLPSSGLSAYPAREISSLRLPIFLRIRDREKYVFLRLERGRLRGNTACICSRIRSFFGGAPRHVSSRLLPATLDRSSSGSGGAVCTCGSSKRCRMRGYSADGWLGPRHEAPHGGRSTHPGSKAQVMASGVVVVGDPLGTGRDGRRSPDEAN